jgi:hypothetical protein
MGPVPGEPEKIFIRRKGRATTIELSRDHGLAPYDDRNFWHPTNWTESIGWNERMADQVRSGTDLSQNVETFEGGTDGIFGS